MQPHSGNEDLSSLEHTRESLYSPTAPVPHRSPFHADKDRPLPHAWEDKEVALPLVHPGAHRVRLASVFFGGALLFFIVALAIAGYFFYSGGNSVSTDKLTVDIQGPTTITGGDIVPLSLTITNTNPVEIQNAVLEVDFPDGTRSAANVLAPYPRYIENIGTLASGATITRSIKAVVFGGAGQTISIPVSFSYGTTNSNSVFEKKSSYGLSISSTPLSVSIEVLKENVSGEPLTFTLVVRSNATVPISNVVLTPTLPFGFTTTSSSVPMKNGSLPIGTLAPGASKQVTVTGTLIGQDNEQRVFHFTVGTAKSSKDQTLAVTYMTQDATVAIKAPFIATTLSLNGDTSPNSIITTGNNQNMTLTYTNTLATAVTDASVSVSISGSAIDYNSINTTNGFYNSLDHSIVFNKDTDSSLASLAPGASGIGSFTFGTLPVGTAAPTVTFSISVSGTRVGQTNVPEQITSSMTKTAKVTTTVVLSTLSSHTFGSFGSSGPIPPRAEQTTTYSVIWNAQNRGSAVAGGVVSATLPSYVSYTNKTSGAGVFAYDSVSRTVTWNVGDLPLGSNAEGAFQITLTPSSSQKGSPVTLTSRTSFTGYDRFAGVRVSANADPVTTETRTDVGYTAANGVVQ